MIVSLLSAAFTFLYIKISLAVVRQRKKKQILYGVGKNREIEPWVSAHSNFSEYVPISLILFFLIERSGAIHWGILSVLAICLFLGRYFHFEGMIDDSKRYLRVRGMKMTLFPMMFMAIANIILTVLLKLSYL